MIACICRAVPDGVIRAAAAGGATAKDIALATGAGTACGCCADFIEHIVAQEARCNSAGDPCPGCPRGGAGP